MKSDKNINKKDKRTDQDKDINFKQNKYTFRKYDKINNIFSKDEQLEKAYFITIEDYNKIKQYSDSRKKIEVKIYSTKDDIIKLINDKIQFVIVNEYFISDFDKSTKFKNKIHIDIPYSPLSCPPTRHVRPCNFQKSPSAQSCPCL